MNTVEVGLKLIETEVEEFERTQGVSLNIPYGAGGHNSSAKSLTFGISHDELDVLHTQSVQDSILGTPHLQRTLPVIKHPPELPFYVFLKDAVLDTRGDAERAARLGLVIVGQSSVYEHRSLLEVDRITLSSRWRKIGHTALPPLPDIESRYSQAVLDRGRLILGTLG